MTSGSLPQGEAGLFSVSYSRTGAEGRYHLLYFELFSQDSCRFHATPDERSWRGKWRNVLSLTRHQLTARIVYWHVMTTACSAPAPRRNIMKHFQKAHNLMKLFSRPKQTLMELFKELHHYLLSIAVTFDIVWNSGVGLMDLDLLSFFIFFLICQLCKLADISRECLVINFSCQLWVHRVSQELLSTIQQEHLHHRYAAWCAADGCEISFNNTVHLYRQTGNE